MVLAHIEDKLVILYNTGHASGRFRGAPDAIIACISIPQPIMYNQLDQINVGWQKPLSIRSLLQPTS
jgi:hypothetical protein